MSRFLRHAADLFDAVELGARAGEQLSDMTILIGPTGGIQMVADCDWPLDSLLAHRGAGMAYRISQLGETVRLEGRAGARTCLFESEKPDGAARRPLTDFTKDLLRPAFFSPGLPAEAFARLLPAAPS